jgi:hypothetical protein
VWGLENLVRNDANVASDVLYLGKSKWIRADSLGHRVRIARAKKCVRGVDSGLASLFNTKNEVDPLVEVRRDPRRL